MISIKPASEVNVDYYDVLQHSSVGNEPNAYAYLQKFLNVSTTYVIDISGEVGGIYGLRPATLLSNSQVYLWLLTTDVVDGHKFEFIRFSEVVIENILKEYEKIIGDTHIKDTRAIKWVRWLGAIYLRHNGELVPFYITRESFKDRRKRWIR